MAFTEKLGLIIALIGLGAMLDLKGINKVFAAMVFLVGAILFLMIGS